MTAEQFKSLLRMQNELNNETNGKWWFLGRASNGKIINWDLCYCMERAELLDWFNWKHWTDAVGCKSEAEVKIELTDMAHFVLSKMLEAGYHNTIPVLLRNLPGYLDAKVENDEDLKPWLEKLNLGSEAWNMKLEEMITGLTALLNFQSVSDAQKDTILKNVKVSGREKPDQTDFVSVLMSGVIGDTYLASSKADGQTEGFSTYIIQEFYVFLALADLVYGFTCDDLFKYYIGKNALNKFRQNHGYKDGTYKKYWKIDESGTEIEDNIVLTDHIIPKLDTTNLTIDTVYMELDKLYK